MNALDPDETNNKQKTKTMGRGWPEWYQKLAPFRISDNKKAVWQLMNTLVPYCCLWYLMIRSIQLGYPYGLTLLLGLIAAAFLVRIFTLFHDCVHRLYRNPLILFGLGAIFSFMLSNRFPTRKVKRKEHMSILFTNLLILGVILTAALVIGWQTYLLIQLPVLWFAGAAGIWLFYVQHQFEGGYWARKSEWEPLRAALEGSSFYKLPVVFSWFSGNIGYHHVHHLGPKIPNYRLKTCFETIPALQAKTPLTIRKSFSCLRLKLWDEQRREMIALP